MAAGSCGSKRDGAGGSVPGEPGDGSQGDRRARLRKSSVTPSRQGNGRGHSPLGQGAVPLPAPVARSWAAHSRQQSLSLVPAASPPARPPPLVSPAPPPPPLS